MMNHLAVVILSLLSAVFAHDDSSWCSTYDANKADYCGLNYFKEYCPHMCETYVDNDDLNGNWGFWGAWSCDTTCGTGIATSLRLCNNPAPKHGGLTCPGASSKTQACEGFDCPQPGDWSAYTDDGDCSATCGAGNTKTRTRTCSSPAPVFGGDECLKEDGVTRALTESKTEAFDCNTGNCPIDGVIQAWGEWSTDCTATCGELGTHTRTRTCQPPQHGGQDCSEHLSETKACNVQVCPINGGYTTWSTWSNCASSDSCGRGYRYKTRCCTNPQPAHAGTDCTSLGLPIEIESCRQDAPCALAGQWSTWSAYGACTVTCDTGEQQRDRSCIYPQPRYTGATCNTSPLGTSETQACGEDPCPVHGVWTDWTSWATSTCTADCKMYIRRCCANPAPDHGGTDCEANGDVGWTEQSCSPGQGLCPTI